MSTPFSDMDDLTQLTDSELEAAIRTYRQAKRHSKQYKIALTRHLAEQKRRRFPKFEPLPKL